MLTDGRTAVFWKCSSFARVTLRSPRRRLLPLSLVCVSLWSHLVPRLFSKLSVDPWLPCVPLGPALSSGWDSCMAGRQACRTWQGAPHNVGFAPDFPPAFPVSGTGIATHLAVPAQTRGSSLIPCPVHCTSGGLCLRAHPASSWPCLRAPPSWGLCHLSPRQLQASCSSVSLPLVSPQNPLSTHQLGHSSANRSAALPGGFLLDLNRAQLSMAPGSYTLWSVPLRPQLFQLPVYS